MKLNEQPKPEHSKESKFITPQLVFDDRTFMPEQEQVRNKIEALLSKRLEKGLKEYGMLLCTFNGRDSIQDCTEELLDALLYIEQAIQETKDEESTSLLSKVKCFIIVSLVILLDNELK